MNIFIYLFIYLLKTLLEYMNLKGHLMSKQELISWKIKFIIIDMHANVKYNGEHEVINVETGHGSKRRGMGLESLCNF